MFLLINLVAVIFMRFILLDNVYSTIAFSVESAQSTSGTCRTSLWLLSSIWTWFDRQFLTPPFVVREKNLLHQNHDILKINALRRKKKLK